MTKEQIITELQNWIDSLERSANNMREECRTLPPYKKRRALYALDNGRKLLSEIMTYIKQS